MNAIELLVERSGLAKAADENIPSPCISVCRMHPDTGWCEGCFRSIPEISAWSRATDADKRRIWALVEQRAGLTTP